MGATAQCYTALRSASQCNDARLSELPHKLGLFFKERTTRRKDARGTDPKLLGLPKLTGEGFKGFYIPVIRRVLDRKRIDVKNIVCHGHLTLLHLSNNKIL